MDKKQKRRVAELRDRLKSLRESRFVQTKRIENFEFHMRDCRERIASLQKRMDDLTAERSQAPIILAKIEEQMRVIKRELSIIDVEPKVMQLLRLKEAIRELSRQ